MNTKPKKHPSQLLNSTSVKVLFVLFLVNLVVVGAAYGLFVHERFMSDTYFHLTSSAKDIALIHCEGYRPVSGAIVLLYDLLGFKCVETWLFNTIFELLSCAACATATTLLLCKNRGEQLLVVAAFDCLSLLMFTNTLVGSMLLFPETGTLMGTAFIFVVLGACQFAREKASPLRWAISFLCLLVVLGIYQSFLCAYICLSALFVLMKDDFCFGRNSVVSLCVVAAIAAVALVVNVLAGKAICSALGTVTLTRIPTDYSTVVASMLGVISDVLDNQMPYLIKNQFGSVWHYSTFVCLLILGCLSVVALITSPTAKSNKEKAGNLIQFVIVLFLSFCSLWLFTVLTGEALGCRTAISFFFWVALLATPSIVFCRRSFMTGVSFLVLAALLAANIIGLQKMATGQHMTNQLDREHAMAVKSAIDEYEQNTGNIVRTISFGHDSSPTYSYPQVVSYLDGFAPNVESARVVSWSSVRSINFFVGTSYNEEVMDATTKEMLFGDRNWDGFDRENQLVFDGDKLYIIEY